MLRSSNPFRISRSLFFAQNNTDQVVQIPYDLASYAWFSALQADLDIEYQQLFCSQTQSQEQNEEGPDEGPQDKDKESGGGVKSTGPINAELTHAQVLGMTDFSAKISTF